MKRRRIFSVFCISFLIFASAWLFGCTSDKSQIIDDEKITIQTINSIVVQNGENSYVEQTVKANIIKNETYTDSLIIDWFLSWEKESNEDISQYIRKSVKTNDSSLCYVKCYKPFIDNNIILTAKIRNSNVQDSCVIVFEGVPSSLNYNSDSFIEYETLIIDGKTIYLLGVRDCVFVDFKYNNIFQNVDKKIFLEDCDIKINSYGNLFLKCGDITQSFDLKDFINSTKDGYASLINYEFDTSACGLNIAIIEKFPYSFVSLDDNRYDTIVNTSENLPYIEFIITDKRYDFSTNFYIGLELV